MSYRVLEHTADTGIEASGSTLPELLEEAAEGMFALMYGSGPEEATVPVEVSVSADTVEDLLVDWLSELLFVGEARELALTGFQVRLDDHSLAATAQGRSLADVELSGPPIKAVTYHQLEVREEPDGWRARVIFDV